jgi:hypothetical protein
MAVSFSGGVVSDELARLANVARRLIPGLFVTEGR